jgi:hypothetical protein
MTNDQIQISAFAASSIVLWNWFGFLLLFFLILREFLRTLQFRIMTLPNQPPTRSATTNHDHIYSTLLGVYAFFLLLGIVSLWFMLSLPTLPAESHFGFHLAIAINAFFLASVIVVLIIRRAFPARRRWPTLALNLILLLSIPLGTALGIYGLLKADLPLRRISIEIPAQ